MYPEIDLHSIHSACLINEDGEIHYLENPTQIGRSADCDIVIDDPNVSRKHAILQKDSANRWWLADLQSKNGTFCNHDKLEKSIMLKSNDMISFGKFNYTIIVPGKALTQVPFMSDESTVDIFSSFPCWLLVGDVVNSTELAEQHGIESINALIRKWADANETIVKQSGGSINKHLGDGFLAFWKKEKLPGDQVCHLLKSIETLRTSVSFDFRLILHYGNIQFDSSLNRGEENLSGDAVNFAFKAEKLASSLGQKLFISQEAANEICAEELQQLGEYKVSGFENEMSFYTLI